MAISFGDRVRVRQSPVAAELGLAGLVGEVVGETTPSVTGVDVIGRSGDYAVAVSFEGQKQALWFAVELLELVDHNPGLEIEIAGKRWIRQANGDWNEIKKPSAFSIWNLFRRN